MALVSRNCDKTKKGVLSIISGVGCLMANAVYAEVELDSSIKASGLLLGPHYTISSELGQQRGANLYHSFRTFNISAGESANFTGPGSVKNVFARVTGGEASFIDGRITNSIGGANLWLINSNGLVFGKNSSIDVGGAFYSTTANRIRFSDGQSFSSMPIDTDLLPGSDPLGASINSDNKNPILVSGVHWTTTTGASLHFISNNISIIKSKIDVDRFFAGNNWNIESIDLDSSDTQGQLAVTESSIDVHGRTQFVSDRIVVGQSEIHIDQEGTLDIDGNMISITGTVIKLENSKRLRLASTGQIFIDRSELTHIGSEYTSSTTINGKSITVKDSQINSTNKIHEHGSDISLDADEAIQITGSTVATSAEGSVRTAGNIAINGGTVLSGDDSTIKSELTPYAEGGKIVLDAVNISLTDVDIGLNGGGSGQALTLSAKETILLGDETAIETNSTGRQAGAKINIVAGEITNSGEFSIRSIAMDSGKGGDIEIVGGKIRLIGGHISATGAADGDTGNIYVTASNNLSLDTSVNTIGEKGSGGNIRMLSTGDLNVNQLLIGASFPHLDADENQQKVVIGDVALHTNNVTQDRLGQQVPETPDAGVLSAEQQTVIDLAQNSEQAINKNVIRVENIFRKPASPCDTGKLELKKGSNWGAPPTDFVSYRKIHATFSSTKKCL